MKNNLIHGVHIFESDLANELDSIVEDAYHYGATEAEIRSLIDTFRKEAVRTTLEKEIFLTLRLAILWQYGALARLKKGENITIAPPIMRFGVKDSCKSIIPITAAITLSRDSNTPLVVADTCFIPYSIKKKGKVVQNTVRYIN